MEIFIAVLSGIFIGGANVIPGVSGGTIAVMLGIYEKLVGSISGIVDDFKGKNWKGLKEDILFLIPLMLGVLVGIILFSKIISYTLEHYYEITMYAFLGLILGSIPALVKKCGVHKGERFVTFLPMIITFLFAVALSVASAMGMGGVQVESAGFVWLFVCGFIASGAMIIPGISGSFLLMLLGCYTLIVDTAGSLLDFSIFFENCLVLAPFGIGILLGIFVISKVMSKLLEVRYKETFLSVIGFVVGSLPILCVSLEGSGFVIPIVACVVFAFGSFMMMKIK